jgi:hypothetical protein
LSQVNVTVSDWVFKIIPLLLVWATIVPVAVLPLYEDLDVEIDQSEEYIVELMDAFVHLLDVPLKVKVPVRVIDHKSFPEES